MSENPDNRELAIPVEAHQFNESALAAYLAEQIPGFDSDIEVRQFLGGQSNPTFLIESSSGSYVLRKKPPGKLLPSAHAVDREFRVTAALAGTGVPVARTRVLCEDENIIGQMFYVMDYVPGRVITDLRFPDCDKDERRAMYLSMIDVLGRLHSVNYKSVGLDGFGKADNYVARQVARWSQQYQASQVDECLAMDQLIDWLPKNDPAEPLVSIVHGDYRPGNIIFGNNNSNVVAVLDWELSTIGHPLADLGYFLMHYHLGSENPMAGLKGVDLDALGIPTDRELVQAYSASVGHESVERIEYYIVFSMFRIAAILAGVLRRGIDGNAADPRAIERGQAYSQIADTAWQIAENL